MSNEKDNLLRELGRAVIEQATGLPGPDGYLLAPTPEVDDSHVNFECPACPGLYPKSGGSGHKEDCPLAEFLSERS